MSKRASTRQYWPYAAGNYGRFYRTALNGLLQRISTYLVRWAKRKYKRLRTFKKVRRWRDGLTARQPRLFAHWAWMTDFKYSL